MWVASLGLQVCKVKNELARRVYDATAAKAGEKPRTATSPEAQQLYGLGFRVIVAFDT